MVNKILVVDDDAKLRENIREFLEIKGFAVAEASNGRQAVESVPAERPSAVLLDLRMAGMDGLDTLKRLRQSDPLVPVIIMTGHGDVPTAVSAIKGGAYDYVEKPFNMEHLAVILARAIEKSGLEQRVLELDTALNTSLEAVFGSSDAMKKVIARIERLAATDFVVLIEGETGTGKTYLANVLHHLGRRRQGPFVKVSIGSLQDSVVESELFGYEKGAFTGADRTRKGYFELADKGTLFIDDLDNISLSVQGKLLSVIEDKCVFRVGSPQPVPLDVRIICATNADLLKLTREGAFRKDLFFRISETQLVIPPLRERPGDIAFFAEKFLIEACDENNSSANGFSESTIEIFKRHAWPGNLRELRNVVRKISLFGGNQAMSGEDVESLLSPCLEAGGSSASLPVSIVEAEKWAIQKALCYAKGQKMKTASILKIDYKTLVKKMRDYGIS